MRAHIAACALKLFHREGYAAISMRRLADEAGCTAMTLYQYYDNKFAILRVLWGDVFRELFGKLGRLAAKEREPQARLGAVALGYVTFWLEHKEHYFMVFMSGDVSQAEVTAFVSEGDTVARFDLLRTSLGEALGGGVTPGELRLKSEVLLCALQGIAHNLITISGHRWSRPEKLVQQAVRGALAA